MKYKEALKDIRFLVNTNREYFSDGIDEDIMYVINKALSKKGD